MSQGDVERLMNTYPLDRDAQERLKAHIMPRNRVNKQTWTKQDFLQMKAQLEEKFRSLTVIDVLGGSTPQLKMWMTEIVKQLNDIKNILEICYSDVTTT